MTADQQGSPRPGIRRAWQVRSPNHHGVVGLGLLHHTVPCPLAPILTVVVEESPVLVQRPPSVASGTMVRRLFAGSFGFAASTTTLTQLLSTAPLPVIFSFATTTTATEVSARKGAKANAASSLAAGTTSTTATTEQTGKVEDADKYRPVLHRRRRHGRAHRKGRRLARAARQMPLKQHLNTHTFHHMVNKGRRARKRSRTPSLDLMKMLAARDVRRTIRRAIIYILN